MTSGSPPRYEIGSTDEATQREYTRLRMLAECRDPKTFAILDRLAIRPDWRCWEVGAGAGTVSEWLATRVPAGAVVSTDVDLRFHGPMPANVDVRQHDVVNDTVGDEFDLIHARAVLQHIPEREQVLDSLVTALRPGGWLVVEDGDFRAFAEQPLPEPLATIHRFMNEGAKLATYREPNFGTRLVACFRDRGLLDIGVDGDTWAMRGGEASGEWWYLAIEHAAAQLIAAGVTDEVTVTQALAQARTPGFVMQSTLSLAVWGRTPARR